MFERLALLAVAIDAPVWRQSAAPRHADKRKPKAAPLVTVAIIAIGDIGHLVAPMQSVALLLSLGTTIRHFHPLAEERA